MMEVMDRPVKAKEERMCKWDTEKEIEYLQGIGTHMRNCGVSRANMLAGYVLAARRRTDWGDIDAGIVIEMAELMLAVEIGGGEHD